VTNALIINHPRNPLLRYSTTGLRPFALVPPLRLLAGGNNETFLPADLFSLTQELINFLPSLLATQSEKGANGKSAPWTRRLDTGDSGLFANHQADNMVDKLLAVCLVSVRFSLHSFASLELRQLRLFLFSLPFSIPFHFVARPATIICHLFPSCLLSPFFLSPLLRLQISQPIVGSNNKQQRQASYILDQPQFCCLPKREDTYWNSSLFSLRQMAPRSAASFSHKMITRLQPAKCCIGLRQHCSPMCPKSSSKCSGNLSAPPS